MLWLQMLALESGEVFRHLGFHQKQLQKEEQCELKGMRRK